MNTYLAVFTGHPRAMEAFRQLPQDEQMRRQQQGSAAWHAWAAKHQGSIVQMGGPLGKTKKVGPGGVEDIRNNLGAFTIVQAESHEAAAKLFEGHPHFTIFPGDGVEVMPVLPIPGQ